MKRAATKPAKICLFACAAISLTALLIVPQGLLAAAKSLLYTVTDHNELAAVDVPTLTATIIGVTQDSGSGPVRRIRGLAYDGTHSVMYGMTREGDLVTIDRLTGKTTFLYSIIPNPPPFFWSGLAFDGVDTLYTANAFGTHELFKIVLFSPNSVNGGASTIVGPTDFGGTVGLQILGLDFYPPSAPVVPPTSNGTHPAPGVLYGSDRNNDNIVVVDKATGEITFPMGSHTVNVNNLQEIAFSPDNGRLYAIHDHFSQSNNAALSVYNFTSESATELGELPFGIVENVGGGNDTYGWGGLTFAPNLCAHPPQSMVAWYPFDEPFAAGSQPNTATELALGNDGTYFPAGPTGPSPLAGKVSWGLNFDGSNDYVESPSSAATNFGQAGTAPLCKKGPCRGDFSIDAWIRLDPSAPSGVMTILDKRSPVTGRGYHFFVVANRLGVQLADPLPFNYTSPTFVLADGLWHHVAVTVKRRLGSSSVGRIRFYDNGAVLTPALSPSTKPGSLDNTSPLRIGARTTSSPLTGWFKGDIDELEIFNEELPPAKIKRIFDAGYFGKCK